MSTKRCPRCEQTRPEEDYCWRQGKKRRMSICRFCNAKKSKQHYQRNKQDYIDRARARKQEISKWLSEYKSQLACSECGENHPAVLDFHHAAEDKEAAVSRMVAMGASIERIQKEIKKCEVLCANCHRKHHYNVRTGSGSRSDCKPDESSSNLDPHSKI